MATVAQLAALPYYEVGYLLVIEGWEIAWTNRVELAGSGSSSWIGNDVGVGRGRTVALGLEVPANISLGIGLVDEGMPCNDDATFTLVDRDNYMIQFAEDEEGEELWQRLSPLDDPAPSTLIGSGGVNVGLHERWVNGEAISPDGERRQFQILPGNPLPGADHASINTSSGLAGLRASSVQDEARWFEGRPCALYLIRKDVVAGTWADWETQYESGYSLIWWGTIKGVPTAQAGAWKIQCEGPSSWLRKPLNVNRPAQWRPLETYLSFGYKEGLVAYALGFLPSQIDPAKMGAVSAYDPSFDTIVGGVTPSGLAQQIQSRLNTLVATAGADYTWSAYKNAKVAFTDEYVKVRLDENNSSPNGYTYSAVVQIRMHMKAWNHMGWDPVVQNGFGTLDTKYELEVAEEENKFSPLTGASTPDPAPGYYGVRFSTRPKGWDVAVNPGDAANKGNDRYYFPYVKATGGGGGSAAISTLQPDARQQLDIGFTDDAPYCEGQLAKPPADVTIASGACDRAGFFAVRGSRIQRVKDSTGVEVDGDVETVYQLGRMSWVDGDTSIGVDPATSKGVVWCEEWLNVQEWGSASYRLKKAWAANDLECVPVALLGYNCHTYSQPDHAHRVLARVLLSSGTAEWTGVGDDASLSYGTNANLSYPGKANDLEIADLGLCIPYDLVDLGSFAAAAGAIPGGIDGPLNRTRLAFIGPFDSDQLIADILRPRGWCFSLAGGRYGLFARHTPIDIEDAVLEITQAHVAADPGEGPPAETVDFRPLEPVDLVEVTYGASQLGGDGRDATFVVQARDPRAAQRRGNAKVDIDGRTLLADGSWRPDFTMLWGVHLAGWFGEPHMTVNVAVKGNAAKDVWPGSVVTYTSPWPATRSGAYGVDRRVGRVMAVEIDTLTLAKRLTILVEGKDPLGQARYAPIARLLDNVTDTTQRNDGTYFYCYEDAFGRGGDVGDVMAFAEPSWSTSGGNLACEVWQSWDGVEWENTATFDVDRVDAPNVIRYTNLVGTVWERRYAVIVPQAYANQVQWGKDVFGVICDSDGTHGAGGTPGRKWVLP